MAKRKKKREPQRAEVITAERPTPERMSRGVWTEPKGMGKNEIPVTDIAEDMVGLLYYRQQISSKHEQAARLFQQVRAAYLAELPEVSGYKSCLAGTVPGFDDGDGDADVIERYRSMERAAGLHGRRELLWVCDDNQRPRNVELLRWALEAVADL